MTKKIFILIAVFIILNILSPAWAQNDSDQVVVVTGKADARVTPDVAFITLGKETEDKTASEAQKNTSRSINKIIDTLTSYKIPKKKIKTVSYNLYYDRDRELFVSTSIIEFPVEKISQVGEILDHVVEDGANIVENVSYSLKNPERARERLLTKALGKARTKAKTLAQAAGFTRIKIKKIDETEVLGPIFAAEGEAEAKGEVSPTTPGELKITASVQVTYTLE